MRPPLRLRPEIEAYQEHRDLDVAALVGEIRAGEKFELSSEITYDYPILDPSQVITVPTISEIREHVEDKALEARNV